MKAELKTSGTMKEHHGSQKFQILAQAQHELSNLRKYLKSNYIPYEYVRNESIKITGGKAYVKRG